MHSVWIITPLGRPRQLEDVAAAIACLASDDATGVAKLVISPFFYERQRRIIRTAAMMAARGKI